MSRFLVLCLILVVLSACGNKGALYIPERKYPQEGQSS